MNEELIPLNKRQELFCRLYSSKPIGKEAAIGAGYKTDNAAVTASQLLNQPNIKARLKQLDEELFARIGITKERIIGELAKIAMTDVRSLYDEAGALLPIHNLPDDASAAIKSIKVYEEFTGRGIMREKVGETREVTIVDKKGAIDSILKLTGWNAPDKVAQVMANGEDVVILPKKDIHE